MTPVAAEPQTAHDFSLPAIDGKNLNLADYRGKALLVVNTASYCGFTKQYDGLQALWQNYRDKGLIVLGVPSNDFGGQEPGSKDEIKEFCSVNFDVDFPMSDKIAVKGRAAHPFYKWLEAETGAHQNGISINFSLPPMAARCAIFHRSPNRKQRNYCVPWKRCCRKAELKAVHHMRRRVFWPCSNI